MNNDKEPTSAATPPLVCGVVLFDHPEDVSAGTAYLPNTPNQRIRSLNDLRNDVMWVSNLSLFEKKIKHHPVVRSGYYLKVSLAEIAQDIGIQSLQNGQMQPSDAQKIAEILTRTLTIAARTYGWKNESERARMTQDAIFSNNLRQQLPSSPLPDARWRESLLDVFSHSYQDRSAPNWISPSYIPNSVFLTLRFNYVNYVKQLLSNPMPRGQRWVCLNEGGVDLLSDPLAYCVESDKPCFARATIEWDNASSELAALAAYGQSGGRKSSMRLWLSLPELRWLSQFATISIGSIWVDESGYAPLPPMAQLPELIAQHPEAQLSYSSHLVAYNHYQALTSQTWNRHTRQMQTSLWAAWLKALDRGYMFSIALKAHQAGFYVVQYGDGMLRLKVRGEDVGALYDFKHEQGFMYPELTAVIASA